MDINLIEINHEVIPVDVFENTKRWYVKSSVIAYDIHQTMHLYYNYDLTMTFERPLMQCNELSLQLKELITNQSKCLIMLQQVRPKPPFTLYNIYRFVVDYGPFNEYQVKTKITKYGTIKN